MTRKNTAFPRLRWLALLTAILLLAALPVAASGKYMRGDSADFQITLDENGGARVTETWACYFGGDTITRYRRHYLIPEGHPYSIEMDDVKMDGEPMLRLDEPDDSRPAGSAAVYEDDTGVHVDMYLDVYEESHTFTVSYYVDNAVILHDDVAEFRWNLTSPNEAFSVEQVTAHIEIPYGTADRGLYFWGHGPAEGSSFTSVVEDGMVNKFDLYAEEVTTDHPVFVRFAMPKELFPGGTRLESGDALDRILEEESKPSSGDDTGLTLWDRAELWMDRYLSKFLLGLAIALCVIPIVGFIFFINLAEKYTARFKLPKLLRGKRCTPAVNPAYYRTLPSTMKPAMVYKLAGIYAIPGDGLEVSRQGSAFSATIMDMIENGFLQMQRNPDGSVVYRIPRYVNYDALTSYEKIVFEIFHNAGADFEGKTTEDITGYMRANYSWCKICMKNFNTSVQEEFDAMQLATTYQGKVSGKAFMLITMLLWGGGVFLGLRTVESLGNLGGILAGIMMGIFGSGFLGTFYDTLHPTYHVLTQEGENQHALWLAYSRYLNDFTTFEEREIPDVTVWRRYLVYATALGCSKRVIEQLRVNCPEVYDSFAATDPYFAYYDDFTTAVEAVNAEGGYTIRSSDSSSDSSDSSDSGWDGGCSDDGGSCDSGGGGSDFD